MVTGSKLGKTEPIIPRIYDAKLAHLLNSSKIIELYGVRGSHKGALARRVCKSETDVDDRDIVLPIVSVDNRIAFSGLTPHWVNEWSALPELQEFAYRIVRAPGSYVMTSSQRPGKPTPYVREHASVAGRITVRTLTLAELDASNGSVSLTGLLQGEFWPKKTSCDLEQVASLICKGGWPAGLASLDSLLDEDLPGLGKKPATARVVLSALASRAGQDVSYPALAPSMEELAEKAPSRNTTAAYIEALKKLYIVEGLPGWNAPIRSASRVRTKPRYLPCDASVLTHLTGMGPDDLLANAQVYAAALKALAIHDVLAYAEAGERVALSGAYYYSDADGVDVDLILMYADGRWAAINIEVGDAQVQASIKRLQRLCGKVAAGGAQGKPAFTAVIVAATDIPRKDKASGAYVFPITSLGV